MSDYMDNETLEGVRIGFRNFSGKEGKYNRAGDRNFVAFLEKDKADELLDKGWSVKYLDPREEGDDPQPYLPITVKYSERSRPPRVVMVTSRGKTPLDEDMIGQLDYAEIINVDMIVRPYQWEVNGATGVKAYLQSIYVTIFEDDLDLKYADTPTGGDNYSRDEIDGPNFS